MSVIADLTRAKPSLQLLPLSQLERAVPVEACDVHHKSSTGGDAKNAVTIDLCHQRHSAAPGCLVSQIKAAQSTGPFASDVKAIRGSSRYCR